MRILIRALPVFLALASLASLAGTATATTITFQLTMTGGNVIGGGDPDGLATGPLTLDDLTGMVSWNFSYENIGAPTAMHIHGPGGSAGSNAGPLIGLGVATSGGAGTLISSVAAPPANVGQIFGNPSDFYVMIHNVEFPGGAVRGQLGSVPEPALAVLLAVSALVLAAPRRR